MTLSTVTSRKISSLRRFRAVSAASTESYGCPSRISSSRCTTCSRVNMCSPFAARASHIDRSVLSNTFSRCSWTDDTTGFPDAGGAGLLACAPAPVSGTTAHAVATHRRDVVRVSSVMAWS
jgi:hypothetical protein